MWRIRAKNTGDDGVRPRRRRVAQVTALALVASMAAATAYRLIVVAPEGPPAATSESAPPAPRVYRYADFAGEPASADARGIADWVIDSGDNQGMPFVVLDKVDARVFVFDASGKLTGASAALLGLAHGDHFVPGIGDKKLSQITLDERTTPAGRYVAEPGVNLTGEQVVWVDYDAGLSMHAVRATNPKERRLQRLASATPADNRISYGCINLPREFFHDVIAPTFKRTRGIVYVLPETGPARMLFGAYEVPASAPTAPAPVALGTREQ